ncbi:MAG: ATP-binding cassette domain-containing protein [Azospirillaceae bacterium]|nr:ATP-binding cassette domain-containing protein [Azospirillaceae bacterium]
MIEPSSDWAPAVPLLEIAHLSKRYAARPTLTERLVATLDHRRAGDGVHAVSDVCLDLERGETLGLVGESGCGKSTLARMVAGLLKPTAGEVRYRGQVLYRASGATARRQRLKVQMVFQDPMASLNPRMTIQRIIGEAPAVHGLVGREALAGYVDGIMVQVGLDPALAHRYPHQFSGGQRQRIAIARALAVKPEILVCDEAAAALDVSVQAQIINLLMTLRRDLGLTTLLISHDLGVVYHICDRTAVMYLGRIVELAPTETLFGRARHPYSRLLVAGMPRIGAGKQSFVGVSGEVPSPMDPPAGCGFHPRCRYAVDRCRIDRPVLRRGTADQWIACHRDDITDTPAETSVP